MATFFRIEKKTNQQKFHPYLMMISVTRIHEISINLEALTNARSVPG